MSATDAAGSQLTHVLSRPWLVHGVGVLSVLSLHATLGRGSYEAWDLQLFDGSWYFGWARDIARHLDFPTWENAPLYCLYYALCHVLFKSVFAIYFAHRAIMLMAINLLGYALFSRLFSPALAVCGVAYLQLLIEGDSVASYAVRPFVLLPFLAAALCATRASRCSGLWILLCLLWAAGCRPEWWVCLPLATVALVGLQLRAHDASLRRPAWVMLALGTAATSFTAYATSGSPRSWLAFGQHFSAGFIRRQRSVPALDPGLHWQTYLKNSFGDANSVFAALVHNPSEMLAHVWQNARYFPLELQWALRPKFPLAPWLEALIRPLNTLWVLAAVLALGALGMRVRGLRARDVLAAHARLLVTFVVAAFAIVLSALVVIPQAAYMYALSASLLACALASIQVWIGPLLSRRPLAPLLALLPAAAIVQLLCPTPYDREFLRIVYPAVHALPAIPGSAPYGLISDSATSFCIYADEPRCRPQEILWQTPQPPDPASFVDSTNTRILLVSKRMLQQMSPAWSSYVSAIVLNPEKQGWQQVAPEPGKDAMIAIYQRL